jgi:predicted metal-dependent phosphoesterase TrpH
MHSMNFDLHCHSTASDGLLRPRDLVRRAHANGVTALALTDHDEVAGLAEAAAQAEELGLRFIPGVEISVTWNGHTLHIVGLSIDPAGPALVEGLGWVRGSRRRRGERIADELARVGIEGSLEGALTYAGTPEALSRSHFARFLVERNYAKDTKHVFHHFLAQGKPGYVQHEWASLAQAIEWINGSGGVAVIAHPGRYRLSPREVDDLMAEFSAHGGAGLEVVTGSHTPEQCAAFARVARRTGLLSSRGSDYHGPGESRADLGSLPPLPSDLKPIWRLL